MSDEPKSSVYLLTFPPGVGQQLEIIALRTGLSLNALIIQAIRNTYRREFREFAKSRHSKESRDADD